MWKPRDSADSTKLLSTSFSIFRFSFSAAAQRKTRSRDTSRNPSTLRAHRRLCLRSRFAPSAAVQTQWRDSLEGTADQIWSADGRFEGSHYWLIMLHYNAVLLLLLLVMIQVKDMHLHGIYHVMSHVYRLILKEALRLPERQLAACGSERPLEYR